MISAAKSKLLPEVFWDTLSQEQKKKKRKVLWDLRQDVDGLRHPLAELSSRKTPPISHRGLEVPASAGLRGAQTRASPTPRRDTQCEQAWAQAWIPGCRLLNLPGTRKYELRGFCPQASVLWTKLHLRRLLLSFASTSTIYPTGVFYRQNRMPDMEPVQERNGSASSSLEYSGVRVFCQLLPLERESKLWNKLTLTLRVSTPASLQ